MYSCEYWGGLGVIWSHLGDGGHRHCCWASGFGTETTGAPTGLLGSCVWTECLRPDHLIEIR